MPGKRGSSWDATEAGVQELGLDGFGRRRVSARASVSAAFEADPEDEPAIDDDLDEDEFDDDLDDDDLDEDEDDDDLDDDLIDLDDEFDDGPEEETRPQHPGKYEE
jgi:hypothetical protein